MFTWLAQVMADLVADKLGADAGLVLAAMLSHGRRFETAVKVGTHHACSSASSGMAGDVATAKLTA